LEGGRNSERSVSLGCPEMGPTHGQSLGISSGGGGGKLTEGKMDRWPEGDDQERTPPGFHQQMRWRKGKNKSKDAKKEAAKRERQGLSTQIHFL